MKKSDSKVLHHMGVGAGFAGLIFWYFMADQLGLFKLLVGYVPSSHAGAALMLAIMIVMAPGFFIWKLYNRWLEKRLNVTGRYYEDDFYKEEEPKSKKPSQ